ADEGRDPERGAADDRGRLEQLSRDRSTHSTGPAAGGARSRSSRAVGAWGGEPWEPPPAASTADSDMRALGPTAFGRRPEVPELAGADGPASAPSLLV